MAIETAITTAIEYFADPAQGRPIFNGNVYVGEVDLDPEVLANRITITVIQENGTRVPIAPAAQPLNTGSGGQILYLNQPVSVVVDQNYSIKVTDSLGAQKNYVPFVQNTAVSLAELVEITYDSVASMVSDITLVAGQSANTSSYLAGWAALNEPPLGGSKYVVITLSEYTSITGRVAADGNIDHLMDNGNIAMNSGPYPLGQSETNALNANFPYENVFRYIPYADHSGIINSTGVTNIFTYLKNACDNNTYVYFPKGQYFINDGQVGMGAWTSENKILLEFDNAVIKYDPTQVFPTGGANWVIFNMTSCEDIELKGTLQILGNYTISDLSGSASGPIPVFVKNGCNSFKNDVLIADGVQQCIQFDRRPTFTATGVALIGNAGTGYSVSDVLTISGGTPSVATQVTVDTIGGGGEILTASVTTTGLYPSSGDTITLPSVLTTDEGMAVTGGTGTGAKFNLYWKDTDESTRCKNINVGQLKATNCWYGLSLVYNGFGVTGQIETDDVFRSLVSYGGIEEVNLKFVNRNHFADSVTCGSAHGLAAKNCTFDVVQQAPVDNGKQTAGAAVRVSYANQIPAIFENIQVNITNEYGTVTGRGASIFNWEKNNDTKPRGHLFNGLRITGASTGIGDKNSGAGAGNLIGTNHVDDIWFVEDVFSDTKIGPFKQHGTGVMRFDPQSFSGGIITFDTVDSNGNIFINDGALGGEFKNQWPQVQWVNCKFPNQYDPLVAQNMQWISVQSDYTIPDNYAYSNIVLNAFTGPGITITWTLPAAQLGMTLECWNGTTAAGSVLRLDPNGTESIKGDLGNGGTGKYLSLDTLDAGVKLKCVQVGIWFIEWTVGILTFEP